MSSSGTGSWLKHKIFSGVLASDGQRTFFYHRLHSQIMIHETANQADETKMKHVSSIVLSLTIDFFLKNIPHSLRLIAFQPIEYDVFMTLVS